MYKVNDVSDSLSSFSVALQRVLTMLITENKRSYRNLFIWFFVFEKPYAVVPTMPQLVERLLLLASLCLGVPVVHVMPCAALIVKVKSSRHIRV